MNNLLIQFCFIDQSKADRPIVKRQIRLDTVAGISPVIVGAHTFASIDRVGQGNMLLAGGTLPTYETIDAVNARYDAALVATANVMVSSDDETTAGSNRTAAMAEAATA